MRLPIHSSKRTLVLIPLLLAAAALGLVAFAPIEASSQPDLGDGFTSKSGDAPLSPDEPTPAVTPGSNSGCWTLQGKVFDDACRAESCPIRSMTVNLVGSDLPYGGRPGTVLQSATTDPNGWYGLTACDTNPIWTYYRIEMTLPLFWSAVRASSMSGDVKSNNQVIEFLWPLEGKDLTGNKFWVSIPPTPTPTPSPQPNCWTLQGKVFDDACPGESCPKPGVTVNLVGSNSPYGTGSDTLLKSATTDGNGWYGLTPCIWEPIWDYYRIELSVPPGWSAVTATSVSGDVKSNFRVIEFTWPLAGKDLTGNKFWIGQAAAPTLTATRTVTPQPSATTTPQPSATTTPQPSATTTPQPSATQTAITPSPSPTQTPWVPTPTRTVVSPTPSVTATPSATERVPGPSATPTRGTPEPSGTLTPTPTVGGECEWILAHGGFEDGLQQPWYVSDQAELSTAYAHGGSHSVRLGRVTDSSGMLRAHIEFPPNAVSVSLTYWWLIESEETDPRGDTMATVIEHEGGEDEVSLLPAGAPRDEWRRTKLNLTAYRGYGVAIHFLAHNNGSRPTGFFLDDVRVRVCYPAPGALLVHLPLVLKGP